MLQEPNGTVSDARMAAFETRLGVPLPADYRAFLRDTNGGVPRRTTFAFVEGRTRTESTLRYFYGLDLNRYDDIEHKLSMFEGRVPGETLPIAGDPLGNLVCLVIRGKNVGQVLFWDHEKESSGRPTYRNMYKIADSFAALIEHLY
jgi:hypothetical protein